MIDNLQDIPIAWDDFTLADVDLVRRVLDDNVKILWRDAVQTYQGNDIYIIACLIGLAYQSQASTQLPFLF